MNVTGTVRTAFVGLLFASGAANAAWVIDFEQFGNGNIINSQLSGEVAPGANVGVTIFGDNKQINGGVTDVFADPPTGLQTTGTQRDIAVVFSTDENDHAQAPEDQDLLALDSTGNQIGFWAPENPGLPGGGNPQSGPGHLPGNVLIIQDDNDYGPGTEQNCDFNAVTPTCSHPDDEGNQAAGQFIFQFTARVFLATLDVFDINSGENNGHPDSEILLYDVNDVLIHTAHTLFTGGDVHNGGPFNTWNRVFLNKFNVKTLVVECKGSCAIDGLVGNTPGVPEPATLALLGLGLVWLGRKQLDRG